MDYCPFPASVRACGRRRCGRSPPSGRADGRDVEAVHDVARSLLTGARKGTPGFLEIDAYRFYGHARMDKSPYRSAEEEAEGRMRDPLLMARARLVGEGLVGEGLTDAVDLDRIDAEAGAEMDAALAFAVEALPPQERTMFEDVFAPGTPAPRPQRERLMAILSEGERE